MKTILLKTLEALLILLIIFILGIFVPLLISTLVVLSSGTTYTDCIYGNSLFWFISFLGWLTAAVYINHEITK